jgi:CheY-like chemotaxis protein
MSTILVIEDDRVILALIESALAHFGHTVVTAADGREGIERFERGEFDVVITDLCMPRLDGRGVVDHIRRSGRPQTPVIGMSGTPWLMQGGGFDRVLPKPFPLERLIGAVAAVDGAAAPAGVQAVA